MTVKKSYTVPCASTFRDAIEALAARLGVNVADVARSVMLLTPHEVIDAIPDPGEPPRDDRESVILKSGPSAGRPWRRKPRLQVRMPAGLDIPTIRKALALALTLGDGTRRMIVDDGDAPGAPSPPPEQRASEQQAPRGPDPALIEHLDKQQGEIDRLRDALAILSFDPLPFGVRSRADALYVLGFRPGSRPDKSDLRGRLRAVAAVHHPDSPSGDHDRMTQVNAAVDFLLARK